jgi:hypothetical protein
MVAGACSAIRRSTPSKIWCRRDSSDRSPSVVMTPLTTTVTRPGPGSMSP